MSIKNTIIIINFQDMNYFLFHYFSSLFLLLLFYYSLLSILSYYFLVSLLSILVFVFVYLILYLFLLPVVILSLSFNLILMLICLKTVVIDQNYACRFIGFICVMPIALVCMIYFNLKLED